MKLDSNKITMQGMLARNNKIKEIHQNGQQFLTNVLE